MDPQIIPTSPAGRKILDRLAGHSKRRYTRLMSDSPGSGDGDITGYIVYLVVVGGVGASIAGQIGGANSAGVTALVIAGLPPAILIAYWIYRLWDFIAYRRVEKMYKRLRASDDIVEVGDRIFRTWSSLRKNAGIDANEVRAMLQNHPEVAKAVVERQRLRDNSLTDTAERELLDAKIGQIMNETLVPLAEELGMINAHQQASLEAQLASDREILQARIAMALEQY